MKKATTILLLFFTLTSFGQIVDYRKLFELDKVTTGKNEYFINKLAERLKKAKYEFIRIEYYEMNPDLGTFKWCRIFTKEQPTGVWFNMDSF